MPGSDRPTVRQLEYLVAVARCLNFRQAARKSHVSQPALSAQIARLEQLLGVVLFERDKKRVLLTPVGQQVVVRAQRMLSELDDIVQAAEAHGAPLAGPLRLGVIPTVAPYVMPQALHLFRERFPKLELFFKEEQTARLLELLRDGKLDLLFLALEAELGDVETITVIRDPFLFASFCDHPLARRRQIHEQDLQGQRVLLLEDGHCLKDQAWAICQARGVREMVDFRASSLSTLAQMVSTGAGVTLLPALAVQTESQLPGLIVRPFQKPVPFRTLGLAFRKTSPRKDLFLSLAQAFAEIAASRVAA
jgi:LysR family hydrogen peroxide-inducible transcriptional activator